MNAPFHPAVAEPAPSNPWPALDRYWQMLRRHRLACAALPAGLLVLGLLRAAAGGRPLRLEAWPAIFFCTVSAAALTLVLATVLGRALAGLLPGRLRAPARFYGAPVLGLAGMTLAASMLGRLLPLGNTVWLPVLLLVLPAAALARERDPGAALRHAAAVAAYGCLCGASILVPLLLYGGYDTNNDAYTYLAHAQWLQQHAFGETLARETLTPLSTQVFIYQGAGLRMGGSFLLAAMQAALNIQWSYEAYPALLVSALTCCCLATGVAIAAPLRHLGRPARFLLLALPAVTLGGLTFGASRGFMPQTVGLALGAGLLFLAGPVLRARVDARDGLAAAVRPALALAVLLAGAALAYTELLPFLLLALAASALVLGWRHRRARALLQLAACVALFAALLINVDLPREWIALRGQAGVLVGSPVHWYGPGFLAHAFGVHGGAWAGFQWMRVDSPSMSSLGFGLVLLACMLAPLACTLAALRRAVLAGPLLPAALLLLIFGVAGAYFRYAVASPFPIGTGQSWNQAKLADWAHPFALALTTFALAELRGRAPAFWRKAVPGVLVFALLASCALAVNGVLHFTRGAYGELLDISGFYGQLRAAVTANCGPWRPVYLQAEGKFREIAALHLADRDVRANWADDPYLSDLPAALVPRRASAGDCVIAQPSPETTEESGALGPYRVYIQPAQAPLAIAAVSGAYPRESDRHHHWYWVERSIRVDLDAPAQPQPLALRFDYVPLGDQHLKLRLGWRDGSTRDVMLNGRDRTQATFETLLPARAAPLAYFSIVGDGRPARLGAQDARMASWMLRDLRLRTPSP